MRCRILLSGKCSVCDVPAWNCSAGFDEAVLLQSPDTGAFRGKCLTVTCTSLETSVTVITGCHDTQANRMQNAE